MIEAADTIKRGVKYNLTLYANSNIFHSVLLRLRFEFERMLYDVEILFILMLSSMKVNFFVITFKIQHNN